MKPTASTCTRIAHLAALYSSLQQLQTFSNEDERMRWYEQLNQLQWQQEVEQQEAPNAWTDHIASLLIAIEDQIAALPLESEGHSSRYQAASAAAAKCEPRFIVEENHAQQELELMPPRRGSIPMMENEAMEETGRGSWDQMPRLMRATTGLTLGAMTRSSIRDRGRSLPLSKTRLVELDAAMGGVETSRDDLSVAVAASSQRVSIGVEDFVERESVGLYRRQESNSLGRSVPSLLRSMANFLRFSMEETSLCQICYDYAPMNTLYVLSICGHTFCETCLKSYLEFKVKEGQVYPKCFFEKLEDKTTCKADILVNDIRSLVSEEVWQKYSKFKFNKEHELARQCPYCDHSQLCAGSEYPECTCEACNGEFCFVHSSAHQGRTCAEYDKKMIAVEKLNNALISKISKPCPGCQNNVEKTGGCNQMKCVICSTSFCWICLKIIDDSVFPEHFQWWNVRGCAGNQMVDFERQGVGQKSIGVALRVLFFVIFGPPAFVLAVVFCVLCCCFYPCTAKSRLTFRQAFTTCFCASGYVLLAPVVLALGLVAIGVVIGGAAAGVAVLVCVSPIVGLMLLFRCDAWHSTFNWRSRSRRSDHVETATADNVENANDQSPRDQTLFLRVSS
ncbi:hypothetical protein KXD40_001188 [Peronospora effusa]|uniref:RBR-type E3 ubiquitin transferase n=1 Tax=Peronospora effusa TaxID=542832 RepID=A0A3M6VKQ5_9STRA|nr:hypothetical protein DD238_005729 [Peronospora effusa]RQM14561.1 hypothetical protein DD237_006192 [Peronospora effusa]UIZ20728.1 hypothetical protein KXD40_001188 [Peronospora effusa]